MPATDIHQSSSFISILSRRRDQVHSMEPSQESNSELGSFQRQVADRFQELSSSDSELLSIDWIRQLLDVFLCCQEEFKAIVFNNKSSLNKAPMDRYTSEYFERSVKALDLCNAIRDGIEQIRQWQNQLEIVLCALDNQRCVGEGQVKRARKALVDLAIGMLDEKQSALAHRNRSFGRNNTQKESSKFGHFRSLSWSVSRIWSASKQLQAISNNLIAPKGNEILSTNGLNVAVFTMHYVLFFVMWALVAAIPCQDRGLQTQFSGPKQFLWSDSILSLHDRILEESKKKDRKNSCGLLKEIHDIEKCARHMNELTDVIHFPLSDENEVELKQRIFEIRVLYEGLKNGLNPLEKQVREVFHRIVRSRTEGLDSVGK